MKKIERERKTLILRIEDLLEGPMIILGFIWLLLLIIELVRGSNPTLEKIGLVIWIIFIVDFLLKFFIAPSKKRFLRQNILTMISLAVPAFRIFRVLRIARFLRFSRSVRLVKVVGSLNRSMRALSATMKKRAIGYVVILTMIVLFAGAAGIYAFEKEANVITNYGTALWWTTMIITTLGSEYWPITPEGRILCVILSLYALSVFGYITATIATFFIGRDAQEEQGAHVSNEIADLRNEIQSLKKLIIESRKSL